MSSDKVTNPAAAASETSEGKQTKVAQILGVFGGLAGAILAVAPQFVDKMEHNSTAYIIAGAILSVISIFHATLTQVAQTKSRTEIKTALIAADAIKADKPPVK